MEGKEILRPLFTYDSRTGVVDVNFHLGDSCLVVSEMVEANSPDIDKSRAILDYVRGIGKKLQPASELSSDELNVFLAFVNESSFDKNMY